MKKLASVLLAVLFVITAMSVVPMTASAAEKVVYVKDGGTGDGSSAAAAAPDLATAYAAIGETDDGVVVLCGTVTFAALFTEPVHAGKITITGSYGGADYNGLLNLTTTEHFLLSGPTTFANVKINLQTTWVIRARFNPLTFDDGVTVTTSEDAPIPKLYIVGGDQGSATEDPTLDAHITLKSGRFYEVIGGGRTVSVNAEYTGNVYMYIGGTAEINKVIGGHRTSTTFNTGSTYLVLDGGKINMFVSASDPSSAWAGISGTFAVVLTKNFDMSSSFNSGSFNAERRDEKGVYYGISGHSAFVDNMMSGIGNSILDYSSKDLTSEEIAKIYMPSFKRVIKFNGATEPTLKEDVLKTGAENLGEAVEGATPAITTEAPAETSAPFTGSTEIIALAVIASLALCGVVFFGRKKVTE